MNTIYSKPIFFSLTATVIILIGTIVTVFIPMFTPGMHPVLEGVKPYSALELTGRDVYQREGCNNCHTQTVRPLKTEVLRYGEYSKAGEFAYDQPFLWGSKRTGPDLARVGGKYPNEWHVRHFTDPRGLIPESNMPAYAWLKDIPLVPDAAEARMKALGFPCAKEDLAKLNGKNELEALIAYTQSLGHAVKKAEPKPAPVGGIEEENPLKGKPEALALGKKLYIEHCEMCHGADGKGDIGPKLIGENSLNAKVGVKDNQFYDIIFKGITPATGTPDAGGMPGHDTLNKDEIWSMVSYVRSLPVK